MKVTRDIKDHAISALENISSTGIVQPADSDHLTNYIAANFDRKPQGCTLSTSALTHAIDNFKKGLPCRLCLRSENLISRPDPWVNAIKVISVPAPQKFSDSKLVTSTAVVEMLAHK